MFKSPDEFQISKNEIYAQVHFYLCMMYLFALLALPRVGGHFKYSELLLPFLAISTFICFPVVRRIFGDKVLTAIALFFFFVLTTNLLSLLHLGAGFVYLVILPVRYIEILVPLFALAVAAYYMPQKTLLYIKYILLAFIAYVILNLFMGFQTGFYGLVVLPGERGPNQVGIVFGLFAIFFLWLYLSKNYKIGSVQVSELSKVALPLYLTALFLVILNVQRTSILAVIITSLLSIIVVLFIRYRKLVFRNLKVVTLFVVSSFGLILVINHFGGEVLDTLLRVSRRFEAFDSASNVRVERWIRFFNLEPWSEITSIFGVGLGSHNYFYETGDFTLRFDSLPLRLLFEMGIVGLVVFFTFHFMLIKLIYTRTRIVGLLAILLTIFMMGMSVTFEAPFVYVPGSMFYALLGIAVGLSYSVKLQKSNGLIKIAHEKLHKQQWASKL